MANRPKSRLGELLLERKVITKKQLSKAVKRQQEQGTLLGSILVDMGVLSEELLKTFLAEQCQVPNLDLTTAAPSREALERISRETAISMVALPLSLEGQRLTVVMGDPLDASVVEALKETTGCDIDPIFAPADSIQEAINRWYVGLAVDIPTEGARPTLQGFHVASENERGFKAALRDPARAIFFPASALRCSPASGGFVWCS
jgi:hypothetical protein